MQEINVPLESAILLSSEQNIVFVGLQFSTSVLFRREVDSVPDPQFDLEAAVYKSNAPDRVSPILEYSSEEGY